MWHLVPTVSPCGDWDFRNWCKILLWMFIFLYYFLLIKTFVCVQRVYVPLSFFVYKTVHSSLTAIPAVSCVRLCDPIDGSPSGSPIPGILQAKTLEWVAISFSNAWKWKVKVKSLSRVQLLATPWTAAHQAPASMGFSRQEHWSGVPLPSLSSLTS